MLLPTVKWAQRPGVVYLTIDVQDAKGGWRAWAAGGLPTQVPQPHAAATQRAPPTRARTPTDPKIDLSNDADGKHGHLSFQSDGAAGDYALDLDLFGGVDTDASKISVTPRQVFLVLEKKEPESWPRLTKESSKCARPRARQPGMAAWQPVPGSAPRRRRAHTLACRRPPARRHLSHIKVDWDK